VTKEDADRMNQPISDGTPENDQRVRAFSAITSVRIETLTDGVFAIVVTLLVFDIRVPGADLVAERGLAEALTSVIPNLLGYVLSFLILGVLWVGHHNQFFYIRRTDRTLLWINIFFMMAVALLPFSAGLLARYGTLDRLALILYDLNLTVAGLVLFVHSWYATRDNHLLNQEIETRVRRMVVVRVLIPPMLYAAAVLVSLVSLDIALAINVIVPLLYILPNRVDAFFRRI